MGFWCGCRLRTRRDRRLPDGSRCRQGGDKYRPTHQGTLMTFLVTLVLGKFGLLASSVFPFGTILITSRFDPRYSRATRWMSAGVSRWAARTSSNTAVGLPFNN